MAKGYRKEMIRILTEMVDNLGKKDSDAVMGLNDEFEQLYTQGGVRTPSDWEAAGDRCRQSCVLGIKSKQQYETYLQDAKGILSDISKY